MAHKSIAHHDANSSDKLELSTLSRGQLIRRVADLRQQLCEQRAHSDCEWELVTIYRDTAEPEREAIMQINHQLLMQIKTAKSTTTSHRAECLGNPRQHPRSPPSCSFDRFTFPVEQNALPNKFTTWRSREPHDRSLAEADEEGHAQHARRKTLPRQ